MGRIPKALREIIGRNIRACRMANFPGYGGSKRCAETFGVSPQQWSPWERGLRMPDEIRLEQIAHFFNVTVDFLRRDNQLPVSGAPAVYTDQQPQDWQSETPSGADSLPRPAPLRSDRYSRLAFPELLETMRRERVKAVYRIEVCVTGVEYVGMRAVDEAAGF